MSDGLVTVLVRMVSLNLCKTTFMLALPWIWIIWEFTVKSMTVGYFYFIGAARLTRKYYIEGAIPYKIYAYFQIPTVSILGPQSQPYW